MSCLWVLVVILNGIKIFECGKHVLPCSAKRIKCRSEVIKMENQNHLFGQSENQCINEIVKNQYFLSTLVS